MDFLVLGPVQLVGPGGIRINLVSDAQRRLLSHLVLRANSIVRSECLEDHLGLSPGALRTSVSRLRRVVGFDTLLTAPPGYELRTDRIDGLQFERLLRQARTSPPALARQQLEDALALWRGDPYAEFAHEDWAEAEAARLGELRAGAVEDLAELEIGEGACARAIARLEEVIDLHPLWDRPRALLMQALAGGGRRADALRQFQAYRRVLRDETGMEPSADLTALERMIVSDALDGHEAAELEAVTAWASAHGFMLVRSVTDPA